MLIKLVMTKIIYAHQFTYVHNIINFLLLMQFGKIYIPQCHLLVKFVFKIFRVKLKQ